MLETIKAKLLGIGQEQRKPPTRDWQLPKHVNECVHFRCFDRAAPDYRCFLEYAEWERLQSEICEKRDAAARIEDSPPPRVELVENLRGEIDEARELVREAVCRWLRDKSTTELQPWVWLLSLLTPNDIQAIGEMFPDGPPHSEIRARVEPFEKDIAALRQRQIEIENKRSLAWLDDLGFTRDWAWRASRLQDLIGDWITLQQSYVEPIDLLGRAICLATAALRKVLSEAHVATGVLNRMPKDDGSRSWGHPWERSKEGPDIIITPVEIAR